jgi:hypothetical protein
VLPAVRQQHGAVHACAHPRVTRTDRHATRLKPNFYDRSRETLAQK